MKMKKAGKKGEEKEEVVAAAPPAEAPVAEAPAWTPPSFEITPIIKGDSKEFLIAAASIVAKVTRDRLLNELDKKYPVYGFVSHKGYCTAPHRRAVNEHGPCPEHRMSYAPVQEAMGNGKGKGKKKTKKQDAE